MVLATVAFGLLLAMAAHTDVLGESLRITLDASRRWMTLHGVHPRVRDAVHDTSVHRTN